MKLGILASGSLGLNITRWLSKTYDIMFILTDSKSVDIINFAESLEIKCFVGNPRKGKGYSFIKDLEIDVLVSVNYLFIIEEDIINHAKKLSFNIHGSLLPKYRGRTPHVWAIINNEIETGITAHKIEAGCDTGAIIEQIVIPINEEDTGNDILLKFNEEYPKLIDKILKSVRDNSIKFLKQNEEKATFFGKRTPNDGLINWNWYKERIYNWIRSQSFPYPGAFTYYNGDKIIIDKVSYSDYGYNNEDTNGLILETQPKLLVKTPNGVLSIDTIRNVQNLNLFFTKNEKFEQK